MSTAIDPSTPRPARYEARPCHGHTDAWEVIATDAENGYRSRVATFVGPYGDDRAKEYATLKAQLDEARQKYADLLSLVVQPWTRDGDGAKLYKVNLAWFDSTDTREKAVAMVEEGIARMKRKGGQG